jgi:hypothetical protein
LGAHAAKQLKAIQLEEEKKIGNSKWNRLRTEAENEKATKRPEKPI